MIMMSWNKKRSSPGNLKILQRRFTTVNLLTEKSSNGVKCAEEAGDKNENDRDGGRLSPVQLSDHADEAPKKQTYLQKRAVIFGGEEKMARNLMQQMMMLREENVAKRMLAHEERKKGDWTKIAENETKSTQGEKR